MAKRTCKEPICERPHYCLGWCSAHYKRWTIFGEVFPERPIGRGHANKPEDEAERRHKIGISSSQRQKGQPKPEITKQRIAATLTGRKASEVHRANLRAAMLTNRESIKATSLAQWEKKRQETGESLGYYGAHDRVRKQRGPAKSHLCTECGKQARDWAQIHGTTGLETDHYRPMCHKCHFRYDEVAKRAMASTTPEKRRAGRYKMWARRSPEERRAIVLKAVATRSRNREFRSSLASGTPRDL